MTSSIEGTLPTHDIPLIKDTPYLSNKSLDRTFSSSKPSDQQPSYNPYPIGAIPFSYFKEHPIGMASSTNERMRIGEISDNNNKVLSCQVTSFVLPIIYEYEYEEDPPSYEEQVISNPPPYIESHNNSSIKLKNEFISRSIIYITKEIPKETKNRSSNKKISL